MSIRVPVRCVILGASLTVVAGCGTKDAQIHIPTGMEAYAAAAKNVPEPEPRNEGSLYVTNTRRSDLFRDFKAREVNDVLTIQVVESTEALSSADAKSSKSTEAEAGLDKLFGLEKRLKDLPSFLSGKANSSFAGTGSTSRATTLRTTLTARVVDVLPSGYLLVEGVHEIRVNNENQSVYLSGIVRPEDISRNNVVLSSRVGEMAVRLQGRGVVSQPLKPGWLYRVLNGVLPF